VVESINNAPLRRHRPDGLTQTPWQGGRCMTWDVTVTDMLAESYLASTSTVAGGAAEGAASRKEAKYQALASMHILSFRLHSRRLVQLIRSAWLSSVSLVTNSRHALATSEKQHFCSNVRLWQFNDLMPYVSMTVFHSKQTPTPNHSDTVFNLSLVFNPRDFYNRWYIKKYYFFNFNLRWACCKAAGPSGVVSDMLKAAGNAGTI